MTTVDPKRKPGTALGTLGTLSDLPSLDLRTSISALPPQVPQASQAAQALATQQPGQQEEKPKPNLFESVGKAISGVGKSIAENPEAIDMLARMGIAFGTSLSGVQSLGARLGTQALAGSEVRRGQDIAERQVAVGEQRAATLESQFQFDKETWESFGRLDAETRTETGRIQAETALIKSNTALMRANTAELDAAIKRIEALGPDKITVDDQVKAIRIYTAKARAAVVSLGFGKLTLTDAGTIFSITDPIKGNKVYDQVFGDEVKRAIITGYLPVIPIVSFQGEDLSKSLIDNLEGMDILKTKLNEGNEGRSVEPAKPVTIGDVNLGDIISGADQVTEAAKREASFQAVQTELESRVETEFKQSFTRARSGSISGRIGRTIVLPPKGSGTEADPYLIYTNSSKDTEGVHKSAMERWLKTEGVYLRINNMGMYLTTKDADKPERVAP